MMVQQPDRVRQYLRRRGSAPSVVKGGLKGLLDHWESLVTAVDEGYNLTSRAPASVSRISMSLR